jgi:hypothetical protein
MLILAEISRISRESTSTLGSGALPVIFCFAIDKPPYLFMKKLKKV